MEVDLAADDLEELLVTWLEELLYQSETRSLLLDCFEVDAIGSDGLRGRAVGRPQAPDEELLGPGIKGVTRHGLRLEETAAGWGTTLYLDV